MCSKKGKVTAMSVTNRVFPRLRAFLAHDTTGFTAIAVFQVVLAVSWLIEGYHGIYYCYRGNMDISEIAHVVKRHRKVAKLSQAELGRLAGVGKTAVFDLEHKKETIRFDVVRKILEALNITVKLGSPLFSMGDEADSPREKEET
jgi:HTH-type transcriptional regulator/antitoxin HipB